MPKKKTVKNKLNVTINKGMSPLLRELEDEQVNINSYQNEILEYITNQVITFIKSMNMLGKTNCIYETPPMIVGFPLYNVTEVSKEVTQGLKSHGLKTIFFSPNKIYVSWKK